MRMCVGEVGRKVHMMTAYLLLIALRATEIQALQHRWNKCADHKKNKSHVTVISCNI